MQQFQTSDLEEGSKKSLRENVQTSETRSLKTVPPQTTTPYLQ